MALNTLFPPSRHATWWLTDLKGIEIGGAAHNQFGLNTINVDRLHHEDPEFAPYASEQMRLVGEVMPVDVVAPGNELPFPDKSYDFVISSHVIEHFFDPISALKEWARVAKKYIYIICPNTSPGTPCKVSWQQMNTTADGRLKLLLKCARHTAFTSNRPLKLTIK